MKKFCLFLTALWLCCGFAQAEQPKTARYATLDWTVAETLLALGVEPVALGDVAGYKKWVEQPALPKQILDLGLRQQPNMEQIGRLYYSGTTPLVFINTDFYAMASSALIPFARVEKVNFYQAGDAWQNVLTATHQIAASVGKPERAVQLLKNFSQTMATLAPQVQAFRTRPLALVQFIDSRHLRIYGENSLLGAVLSQLGLVNAWQGEHNYWGFATIDISQLAHLPAHSLLVVIKPYPANLAQALNHNSLWQYLDMQAHTIVLPPIWTFGAIPSAQRFAQALVQALHNGGEAW